MSDKIKRDAVEKLDAVKNLDDLRDAIEEQFGTNYFGLNPGRQIIESIEDPDSDDVARFVLAW